MEEDITKEEATETLAEVIRQILEEGELAKYPEQEFIPSEFMVKYKGYSLKIKVSDAEEEPKVEHKASLEGSDTEEGERDG